MPDFSGPFFSSVVDSKFGIITHENIEKALAKFVEAISRLQAQFKRMKFDLFSLELELQKRGPCWLAFVSFALKLLTFFIFNLAGFLLIVCIKTFSAFWGLVPYLNDLLSCFK